LLTQLYEASVAQNMQVLGNRTEGRFKLACNIAGTALSVPD
jgi:hypothetical protein